MSELVGSVFIGLADIVTDGVVCAQIVRGVVKVPSEGYTTAYIVILCLGSATTVLSLAYRLHIARLVRAHVRELGEQAAQGRAGKASATRRQAQQNEWELAQTHRTKVVLSLALVSVAAQGSLPLQAAQSPSSPGAAVWQEFRRGASAGLPMSVINCRLIVANDVSDKMVRTRARRKGTATRMQLESSDLGRCLPRCSCRCSWSASS